MEGMILYKVVRGPLGPYEARMMEYLWAGNGLFIQAKRKGLAGIIPVADVTTPGLSDVETGVIMDYEKVPEALVADMLRMAKEAKDGEGRPLEILFRLWWEEENKEWCLDVPEQVQQSAFCKPLSKEPPNTIIEIHSHHRMEARFSGQDNRDEKGFRLYGVMGEFEEQPVIRMRLGIFGQYGNVLATDFLELPEGIKDGWEVAERSWKERRRNYGRKRINKICGTERGNGIPAGGRCPPPAG